MVQKENDREITERKDWGIYLTTLTVEREGQPQEILLFRTIKEAEIIIRKVYYWRKRYIYWKEGSNETTKNG